MRGRTTIVVATAVSAVMLAGAALAVAATGAKPATTKVKCTIRLVPAIPPGATAPNPASARGAQFGLVSCGKPFGSGVQEDAYTAGTKGVSGPYKEFFNAGTISGKYSLTFTPHSPTNISYNGTYSVLRGTGAYAHTRGAGTLTCSTPDGGVHISCTGKLTLTHA